MQIRGRVALVTGAGRRVGRAIAEELGRKGMRVAVHYGESGGGATETANAIADAGGEARTFQSDLTDAESPAALVDAVASSFGALDVVVNSAAVMLRTPVGSVSTKTWDRIFALNVRAPFFIAQAAVRHMPVAGAIVNIADLAAFETWPDYVPHNISKGAVVQMTRSMARVYAPKVRVNAVAPGAILAPEGWSEESLERLASTTPLQRVGAPADVVGAVLYLLEAEYVTGETLIVDGGRHVRR